MGLGWFLIANCLLYVSCATVYVITDDDEDLAPSVVDESFDDDMGDDSPVMPAPARRSFYSEAHMVPTYLQVMHRMRHPPFVRGIMKRGVGIVSDASYGSLPPWLKRIRTRSTWY